MLVINEPGALAAFRAQHTRLPALFELLGYHKRVLAALPPGAGKTHLARMLLRDEASYERYTRIVLLPSANNILDEFITRTPELMNCAHLPAYRLYPRDGRRCGPAAARWKSAERRGLGVLARQELCANCPDKCSWPTQLAAERLEGQRLVLGMQAYLSAIPDLTTKLTVSPATLFVLDEPSLVTSSLLRAIDYTSLTVFTATLSRVNVAGLCTYDRVVLDELRAEIDGLLNQNQAALTNLRPAFRVSTDLALAIQEAGDSRFGDSFRYVVYDLMALARSPVRLRRYDTRGVTYVFRPRFPAAAHVLVLGAGLTPQILAWRWGDSRYVEWGAGFEFRPMGTEILNLRSPISAMRYFDHNARQLADVVAQLVIREAAAGIRSIAVTKLDKLGTSVEHLQAGLRAFGRPDLRAVANPNDAAIADPMVVPVIHYGLRGINTYSDFGAAFAMCSYNMSSDVLEKFLNEVVEVDRHLPYRILAHANDGRRAAGTFSGLPSRRFNDRMAQHALRFLEYEAVQALGRVRPFTQPRRVLFMQGALPFKPDREWDNLESLRHDLGLVTRREYEAGQRHAEIVARHECGESQQTIANAMNVDVRTVRRHLRPDTNASQ